MSIEIVHITFGYTSESDLWSGCESLILNERAIQTGKVRLLTRNKDNSLGDPLGHTIKSLYLDLPNSSRTGLALTASEPLSCH